MKKRNQNSQKGFMQSMIHIILIIALIFGTFHSCQEDNTVLVPNSEALTSQLVQLKSATISIAAIDALIVKIEGYVADGDLEPGIANALISKLENAIKSLEKGNEKPAMNQLQAVVKQLESLVGNGTIDSEVGEEIIFDTEVLAGENPTFIDKRDNREYKTILIGDQCWMAENLAYETETGSWAYDNDENNVATYGRLYNWDAAMAACPAGWHLPSDAEWTVLSTFLIENGYGYEWIEAIAKALAATTSWNICTELGSPGYDLELNNSCGFSGLPGGKLDYSGYFLYVGNIGYWWSSTESSSGVAWVRCLIFTSPYFFRFGDIKRNGFSVRCVKD